VHPQHIGPQLFVSEGVIAEDVLTLSMFPPVIVSVVVSIVPSAFVVRATDRLACGEGRRELCDGEREREREYD
jgi:hypothetical protein